MKNIFVIAGLNFKEAIRDRVLYAILGFALIFILADLFMARLSIGDPVMIKSFGLAGVYIFGLLITIFLGASIIYKEIERRTLYFVLSKPVSRADVVLGKFLGLFAAVALTTLVMAVIYLGVIFYEGLGFDYLGLAAIGFQIIEEALLSAILIFFSSFSAPLTSTLASAMILFIGHLLDSMMSAAREVGGATYLVLRGIYYALPNLEKFNLRNLAVHNILVSPAAALYAAGYALLYIIFLLAAAKIFFERREL